MLFSHLFVQKFYYKFLLLCHVLHPKHAHEASKTPMLVPEKGAVWSIHYKEQRTMHPPTSFFFIHFWKFFYLHGPLAPFTFTVVFKFSGATNAPRSPLLLHCRPSGHWVTGCMLTNEGQWLCNPRRLRSQVYRSSVQLARELLAL